MKNTYLTQDNTDAKRLKGLLNLYDAALTACVEKDLARLEVSLDVLQGKLNFDAWPSLGLILYAQYNRCRLLGRGGNFMEAGRVLAILRGAWTSGDKRKELERVRQERIAKALRAKEAFVASAAPATAPAQ